MLFISQKYPFLWFSSLKFLEIYVKEQCIWAKMPLPSKLLSELRANGVSEKRKESVSVIESNFDAGSFASVLFKLLFASLLPSVMALKRSKALDLKMWCHSNGHPTLWKWVWVFEQQTLVALIYWLSGGVQKWASPWLGQTPLPPPRPSLLNTNKSKQKSKQ